MEYMRYFRGKVKPRTLVVKRQRGWERYNNSSLNIQFETKEHDVDITVFSDPHTGAKNNTERVNKTHIFNDVDEPLYSVWYRNWKSRGLKKKIRKKMELRRRPPKASEDDQIRVLREFLTIFQIPDNESRYRRIGDFILKGEYQTTLGMGKLNVLSKIRQFSRSDRFDSLLTELLDPDDISQFDNLKPKFDFIEDLTRIIREMIARGGTMGGRSGGDAGVDEFLDGLEEV
jgi:hypothetical protein